MTQDELSSVLLKLVGFTVVVHAIVGLPETLIGLGYYYFQNFDSQVGWQILAILTGVAAQIVGGLLVIAKSSTILQWLFTFGQGTSET